MSSIVEKSNLVDSQDSKSIKARSKFDLSHHHLTTLPFGQYVPFFSMECVNGDDIKLRSQHSLNTFTLKSPILSNIRMRKDYFSIPMEAILPFNWDKIISNPLFGDDVNADDTNCILDLSPIGNPGFISYINSYVFTENANTYTCQLFNILNLLEVLFSKGSLLSRLGFQFNSILHIANASEGMDLENGIDDLIEEIYNNLTYVSARYYNDEGQLVSENFNLNSAEKRRKFHDFALNHVFAPDEGSMSFSHPNSQYTFSFVAPSDYVMKFNIAPVCAYQIACAHYLTNDKVDSIYSAELYRQLMHYLSDDNTTFKYNDVDTFYDFLSGKTIKTVLTKCINSIIDSKPAIKSFLYVENLFGFRRSLRYLDYFTGAKTHPLALGDTSVQVTSGNSVDVVDVTKGLQMQRFLNFVNRTGRKFEEYISKLNGRYVAPDYHNPQFLGSTVESLYNPTVENTGTQQFELQNSITSTIKGDSERFAFQFESDRPSIIIGIVSFDIVRAYANNVIRDGSHIDRFDYFNPFLQHIGDQPVYGYEYRYDRFGGDITSYFGYQTRHSEYKTAVSRADSGFIDGSLPSWAFLNEELAQSPDNVTIDSNIIRSYPEELDKFYIHLPGISLSKYFHFIVDFYNIVEASRPMIANPNIL